MDKEILQVLRKCQKSIERNVGKSESRLNPLWNEIETLINKRINK